MISTLVKCAKCNGQVDFQVAKKRGLGFNVAVVCEKCETKFIPSSSYIGTGYGINQRIVLLMRILGIGFKGVTKFCGLMDF